MDDMKVLLSDWFQQIRSGYLDCPLLGCTKTFLTLIELTDHVKENCNWGRFNGPVICTHCEEKVHCDKMKSHWTVKHCEILNSSKRLMGGETLPCPNSICKERFTPGFEEMKRFMDHTINCQPLYFCANCNQRCPSRPSLITHQKACIATALKLMQVTAPEKKEQCTMRNSLENKLINPKKDTEVSGGRNEATGLRISSENELLSVTEDMDFAKEWRQNVKEGKLICPLPGCQKRFYLPENFFMHLKAEKEKGKIFQHINKIECPFCNDVLDVFQFHRHMRIYHIKINSFLKELWNGKVLTCPNASCKTKQTFNTNTGFKYLMHAIHCRPSRICKNCNTDQEICKCHKIRMQGSRGRRYQQRGKANSCSDATSTEHLENEEIEVNISYSPWEKKSIARYCYSSEDSGNINVNVSFEINHDPSDFIVENNRTPASFPLLGGTNGRGIHDTQHNSSNKQLLNKKSSTVRNKISDHQSLSSLNHVEERGGDIRIFHEKWDNTKTKVSLTDWHQQIQAGYLDCPFDGCTETFVTVFLLTDHLKEKCKWGRFDGAVICTHCDEKLPCAEMRNHWADSHKDILNSSMRLLGGQTLACPNFMCKEIFMQKELKRFLEHTIHCRPLYFCANCYKKCANNSSLIAHQKVCIGTTVKLTQVNTVSNKETTAAKIASDNQLPSTKKYDESSTKNDAGTKKTLSNDQIVDTREGIVLIHHWKKEIKSGKLVCPVPECQQRFYVPNYFISHLKKEKETHAIFSQIYKINCPLCQMAVELFQFHQHMQIVHTDITDFLSQLKERKSTSCPNELCPTGAKFNSASGDKYLLHAIKCRPLYICKKCNAQRNDSKLFKVHVESCCEKSTYSNDQNISILVQTRTCNAAVGKENVKKRTRRKRLESTENIYITDRKKLLEFKNSRFPIVLVTDIRNQMKNLEKTRE